MKRIKRITTSLLVLVVITILLAIAFALSVRLGIFGSLPTVSQLQKLERNNASRVFSADGKLLGLYYYQNRTDTRLEDVPRSLIDGLVATEDARFYEHHGFDFRSFLRVMFKSILLSDRSAGGGSTISQQLAKNIFPREDHGLLSLPVAKVKEIIIARRLEKVYSKDQILELYLNTVSFGENTYGIETAALTYFNKKPKELSINESAMLVGLLKANTGYNPRLHQEAARERRNTVLAQMAKYGYLDEGAADSLKQFPVELHYTKLDHIEGPAPYFREFLRHEAEVILKEYNEKNGTDYNLYSDGLTLQTTIHSGLQAYAEASVKEQLAGLQVVFERQWRNREPWKRNPNLARLQITQSKPYQKLKNKGFAESQIMDSLKVPHRTRIFTWKGERDTVMSALDSILYHFGILQGGMMAMDGQTGAVLAWVGGPDYKYFKYDHVLAARQVGSTIKPLVYATAIENGVQPCDLYKNDSIIYEDYDNWVPKNADNRYGGYYSVQGALVNSVNTVSVQLLMETGIETTRQKLQQAGITTSLPEVPSLALGSAEIPLYQMVRAYSVFLNEGRVKQPFYLQKITDASGKTIYENPQQASGSPVFSASTMETMEALLMGVTERGTAASLRTRFGLRGELAGKTGTTQNQTDGWFMGMTPELIVGVWVGGDSPLVRFRDLSTGQGGRTALPIFARFIQKIQRDPQVSAYTRGSFSIPEETFALLACADFKESRGIFDFFKKEPEPRQRTERQARGEVRKKEEEQTKVGRFLKKVFGKKDRKK